MPGDSGVTVVTNARVYYSTRAAAGASSARHSPRPLLRGRDVQGQNSAGSRREIAKLYLASASCAPRHGTTIPNDLTGQHGFASLRGTNNRHSDDRNNNTGNACFMSNAPHFDIDVAA